MKILDAGSVRRERTRRNRNENAMHDLLLASLFVLMILAPCLVSLRSGVTDENS